MGSSFNPLSCYTQDGCIKTGEGELLAECEPRVLRKTVLLDPQTDEKIRTDVTLHFISNQNEHNPGKPYTVDLAQLDRLKLADINPDLYTISDKKFVAYIKSLIPNAPTNWKYCIERYGWSEVKGQHIYYTGNEIIGGTEDISLYSLDANKDILCNTSMNKSGEDSFNAIWDIFDKCGNNLRIACMYMFGSVLRQPCKDAGYVPRTTLYIVAKTQSGKTTFVQGMGCPFVSDNGEIPNYTRVSSTRAVTEEAISRCKDMLYIYDDVYVDNKRIRNGIEERVKGVLRNSADNAPRRKVGADNQVNAQLLLIGENLIGGISNLGRMLIVHLQKKIDSKLLNYVVKNKKHIRSFYFDYIKWLSENYNDVVEMIKSELQNFRDRYRGGVSRDFDTEFFIMCCTKIFCNYANDRGFISEKTANNTCKGISNDLAAILAENHTILTEAKRRENRNKPVNYSKVLLNCLNNDYISLGKEGTNFFEHNCKGEKCYFIRCEYFRKILSQFSHRDVSAKNLTDYFRKRDIGVFGNDGRLRQYKPNKKRYLVLKKKALKNDANSDNEVLNELFE